jgi:hypothetical protein
VNRHRLELFVLDRAGRTFAGFTRLLWSEDEVVRVLTAAAGTVSEPAVRAAAEPA